MIDPTQAAENSQSLSIIARGKVDIFDKNNLKSALALSGKVNMDDSSINPKDLSAAGQIVFLNNKLFFKIIEFPKMMDSSNQSQHVINKWIIFPSEYLGAAQANRNGLNPFFIGGQPLDIEASLSASLIKNQIKVDQIYIKNRFLITKTNPDQKINGMETKHYSIKIDPLKLKVFIKEVLPIIAADLGQNADEIKWDDATDKQFTEFTNALKDLDLNLWIGKNDTNLYKLIAYLPVSNPNNSTRTEISASITFKDYNLPMNISEPQGAVTFEELTSQIMQVQSQSPDTNLLKKSRDSTRLTDLAVLRRAIEMKMTEPTFKKLPVCGGGLLITKCTTLVAPIFDVRNATGNGWIPIDLSSYVSTLPIDPSNGEETINSAGNKVTFKYYFRSNGTDFKLAAYLEDPSNSKKVHSDGGTDDQMFETGTDLTSKLGI